MASQKQHLPLLDNVRGFAILIVFLFHSVGASYGYDHLPWQGAYLSFDVPPSFLLLTPLTLGWAGVAIFFAVSGFCIHLSHARSLEPDFECFFLRRFFRIYPPYFAALLIFSFLPPWNEVNLSRFTGWGKLLSHLLLVHNLNERSYFSINPSFWSIAAEAQLYLFYPLFLRWTKGYEWRRTLVVCGISELSIRLAFALFSGPTGFSFPRLLTSSPFAYALSWGVGAALAETYRKGEQIHLPRGSFWLLVIAGIAAYGIKYLTGFSFLLFALATVVYIANQISRPASKACNSTWIQEHWAKLGVASYSFYLFHQPILLASTRLLKTTATPHLLLFLICLAHYPLIFLISSWSHRWLEVTSTQAGRRLISWRKAQRAPSL